MNQFVIEVGEKNALVCTSLWYQMPNKRLQAWSLLIFWVRNYFFLYKRNYFTSEGAVSHNVLYMYYQQLSIAGYQVIFYDNNKMDNYQVSTAFNNPLQFIYLNVIYLFDYTCSTAQLAQTKQEEIIKFRCERKTPNSIRNRVVNFIKILPWQNNYKSVKCTKQK